MLLHCVKIIVLAALAKKKKMTKTLQVMTGGAESGLPRGNLISSLFRAGLDVDEQVGSCSSLQPPSSDSESRFAVSPVSR